MAMWNLYGYSEAFHLEGVNDQVKEIYMKIKDALLKTNKNLVFNPKKYYISILYNKTIAFFRFRRKKIRLVVLMPEEEVKTKVKKHTIVHLSEGVQKFWNAASCEIIIDNIENIDEIIHLLKSFLKENISDSTNE